MKHRSSGFPGWLKGNDTSRGNAWSTCELASSLRAMEGGHTISYRPEFRNSVQLGVAMRFFAFSIFAWLILVTPAALAQKEEVPKSIAGSVGGALGWAEKGFLGVAEAMPEEKYSYIPTQGNFDGVRSFGEQVKHVACAQFAFFNEIEGKTPPEHCEKGGPSKAKTKAELLRYLRDSFEYGDKVLATITAQNAVDRVEGPYAGPNTKLGMAMAALWHVTDHFGQLVVYLRLSGIVPPVTQQYPLKVR
jgi:uncharacterized damage-inducible protein DinB